MFGETGGDIYALTRVVGGYGADDIIILLHIHI